MKPLSCNLIRSTAAVCVLMVSGFVQAEDGVVRISDKSSSGASTSGIVRMNDRSRPVQPVNHTQPVNHVQSVNHVQPVNHMMSGAECAVPQDCHVTPDCCAPETCCPVEGCNTFGRELVGTQSCGDGMCCAPQYCDPCSGYGACQNGYCNGGHFGQCHQDRMHCLFAGSACSGTGCPGHDCWRGQSMSFQAKNSRLANKLFGWLIPSGCNGQGAPPVGKYQVTYADQPGYADPRDSQVYAAHGYGMPMTVPLAPNVHQQYNYSWGVPASRITPISNYNPMTSPQPLYHQSW